MGWSKGKGSGKAFDILRPHRLLGIRSPIDRMIHPTDKYNRDMKAEEAAARAAEEARKAGARLPDAQDISIRRQQAKELTALLKRRGGSSTLLSGRAGDNSSTPMRRSPLGRSGA